MKYILKISFVIISTFYNFNSSFAQQYEPFNWQYPLYGSHSINKIEWIGAHKFLAVGAEGMILFSEDDGNTWSMNQQLTQVNLKAIFVKDSNEVFIAGSSNFWQSNIYKSQDGCQTWSLVYSEPLGGIEDMFFVNDTIGFIVGNSNLVLKTIDGGNTWINYTDPNLTGSFQCVWFMNPDTGYVGGNWSQAGMYKTIDGGLTWLPHSGFNFTSCITMEFLNDTLGFAASGQKIFRTTDRGETWIEQIGAGVYEYIRSFSFFPNSTTGVAIGQEHVFRTVDGLTWLAGSSSNDDFSSGTMNNNGTLILGTSHGALIKGTNLGYNFTNLNPGSATSNFNCIKFIDPYNGWVCGQNGALLKTNDGGQTWSMANGNLAENNKDMAVISPDKVIIARGSFGGAVITTIDGGNTFTTITLNNWIFNAISFPSANVGYVVGIGGISYKTFDGGITYSPITNILSPDNLVDVFFVNEQYGFIVGEDGGIIKTTNGMGFNFLNVSGIGVTKRIYFTNTQNGYTINEAGNVFRTTDGGNTFSPAGQTCTGSCNDFQFINDSTGFVVGNSLYSTCDISYTTNYGNTWNSLMLPYANNVYGVYAFDTTNIYLCGQYSTILKTGVNGVVTNLKQKTNEKTNLKISPNPVADRLKIEWNYIKENNCISIFDINGCLISQKQQLSSGIEYFNTSELPSGVYFVELISGDLIEHCKFIKQ